MTLKQYLTIMFIATTLCWVSWVFVLINVDPFVDTGAGMIFFYVTLLFSLVGTMSLFSFLLVQSFWRNKYPMYRAVKKTFSFGFVSAVILLSILFLQGQGLLELWNIVLLLIIISGSLFFYRSIQTKRIR